MEYTWKEIAVAILGSSGIIGGLLTGFTVVSGRLDARRKRLDDGKNKELHESVEAKKLEAETKRDSVANLWRMIDALERVVKERDAEIALLEVEIKESTLSQKEVYSMYTQLRLMEEEIDHMNLMTFDQEKTNVFMRRFNRVKELINLTRDILP